MNKNINYDRWEDFSNLKNQSIIWRERNKIIGDIIIKDFIFSKIDYKPIILDIGCCDMFLEDYLKKIFLYLNTFLVIYLNVMKELLLLI